MDATYIQQTIEKIKTNIFQHVRHRTLLQYTGTPVLDENQLFYLLLPFLNGEKWDDHMYLSAVTVGIVHISLNEHEKISEKHATSKEQQLTVLSGDYYSGRYYEILASIGNIPLIKQLSEGIANRCEQQIKVYESKDYTLNDWFEAMTVVQAELIERFYHVYGFEKYTGYMRTGLRMFQLERELSQLKMNNPSLLMKKMMLSVPEKDGDAFIELIEQEIHNLNNILKEHLSSIFLNVELNHYIQRLITSNE